MDSSHPFSKLLSPIKVGDLEFPNRIAMAALTRMRADPKTSVPNDLHVKYYSQRANAGFILTECSPISDISGAFPGAAGIWNDEQAKGWAKVVDAVHKEGGKIIMQIWHSGSAAHSTLQEGRPIWSSSAVAKRGTNPCAQKEQELPHAMTVEEIKTVIEQFRSGAQRAKEAGLDGLQLHGAHGYLVDQFLRTSANKRTDEYGGSIENRSRFCLEAIDALISVFGAGKVGIKVTPVGRYNDMYDEDPVALYTYLFAELDKRGVAFIELKDDADPDTYENYGYPASKTQIPEIYKTFRPLYKGTIVANCNFKPESAEQLIRDGLIDMVSFGRYYIANPDLKQRIEKQQELNTKWDYKTFYGGNEVGYSDYPTYEEAQAQAAKVETQA